MFYYDILENQLPSTTAENLNAIVQCDTMNHYDIKGENIQFIKIKKKEKKERQKKQVLFSV